MKKSLILTTVIIFFITISILNFACKKDKPEPLVATSIELVSGSSQTAQVSTTLSSSIVVLVKDQDGNAFKGATVKFAVAEGSLSATTGTTDANGKATVNWTLGASEGTQTLTVTAFKADGTTALTGSPISVKATASPEPPVATSIEIESGNNQTAKVLSSLVTPIAVLVKDQYGNAFAGTEVSFTVSEGSVSAEKVTTDANGNASVTWTLGATKGTQTLNATVSGLTGSPLNITATALDATTIEIGSGNNQTAQILTTLANPVVVTVKDQNGNAFSGTEVNFTVTEGSVSAEKVTTDANGNASVTWILGATLGTQTLNATVTGLTGSPVEFTATGVACMDYDGNIYNVVTIGTQTWMAENLKVTHYSDGSAIDVSKPAPAVYTNTEWGALGDNDTDKAYCFYNDDTNSDYGALYTYAAATNGDNSENNVQGVCPTGWHLPNDAEWLTLENEVETGPTIDINEAAWRGTDVGQHLKEDGTSHWNTDNADNSSNFTAMPGGYRNSSGIFNDIGNYGRWWTATDNAANVARFRWLSHDRITAYRHSNDKSFGYSVRCIKD